MTRDLGTLLPELLLACGAVLGLLLGSYLPRARQWLVRLLAAAVCAGGLLATVACWPHAGRTVFEGGYAVDAATGAVRVAVLGSVLLVLGLAAGRVRGDRRETEFVVLLLLGALGSIVLAGANGLLLVAAAYLLAGVPLSALAAFAKDPPGTEAALKYYLMAALAGGTMLFGLVILFGVTGATGYPALAGAIPAAPGAVVAVGAVLFLAGPLVKAAAVPVHFWLPDAAEGAGPPAAAVLTTIPKLGAVVACYRFADAALAPAGLDWRLAVAVLAALTMTLGNLAAFFQDNVRRLLGYSAIAQVGYLLMAVAAAGAPLALPGLLLYLAAYAVTNLGAFAVVSALPRAETIGDHRGLLRRHRPLALALVVCLLGLVGTPPTGVFAGKLAVFTAAYDAGLGWLTVVAIGNTVASLFYYLRWLAPAVRTGPGGRLRPDRSAAVTAYVAAVAALLVGVLAGPVLAAVDGGLAPR